VLFGTLLTMIIFVSSVVPVTLTSPPLPLTSWHPARHVACSLVTLLPLLQPHLSPSPHLPTCVQRVGFPLLHLLYSES
jgi:hypothetical protein